MKNLLRTIESLFFGKGQNVVKRFRYPKSIGNYSFLKAYNEDYHHRSFKYAIYANGNKRAFAKIWQGKKKNFDYVSLENEANAYALLQKKLANVKQDEVRIPKMLAFSKSNKKMILLTEFVDGGTIEKLSASEKVRHFEKVHRFLSELQVDYDDKLIKPPSLIVISLVFPIFLCYYLASSPKSISLVARCFLRYLNALPHIPRANKHKKLVHKSLENQNILLKDGTLYLIDFQLSTVTHPFMEHVQTLFFSWEKREFRLEYLGSNLYRSAISDDPCIMSYLALFLGLQQKFLQNPCKIDIQDYLEHFVSKSPKVRRPFIGERVYASIFKTIARLPISLRANKPFILCYHSISNDKWAYSTSISEFKKQIDYIATRKKVVPLKVFLKSKTKENQVSITFDDGYADFYKNAFPILEKYGIKGTLFVVGADDINRKEIGNKKRLLSVREIKKIKKAGWEIGFHSNTHSNLKKLNDAELYEEIVIGKLKLEKKLGFKISYFAYPMGLFNKKVLETVSAAGFTYAFTTRSGNIATSHKYLRGRVCLRGGLTLKEFAALTSNLGLAFNNYYEFFITFKSDMLENISRFIRYVRKPGWRVEVETT